VRTGSMIGLKKIHGFCPFGTRSQPFRNLRAASSDIPKKAISSG
jgi:hypothetical protein